MGKIESQEFDEEVLMKREIRNISKYRNLNLQAFFRLEVPHPTKKSGFVIQYSRLNPYGYPTAIHSGIGLA